jgi:hypothetical protein
MQRLGGGKVHESGRNPGTESIHRLKLPVLALIAFLAILGMLPSSFLLARTANADSPGTLAIIVPNPTSSNTSLGPVGTNVTITGTGLTASDTYQIGFATQDATCTSGFQAFGNVSVTTDTSGNFATTFAWPSSLANVGTVYYICAEDAASSLVQSQTTFTVAGAQPPTITAKSVPGPTPGPGTPSVPTTGFYPASTVEIDGTSFLPGATNLVAYLASSQVQKPSDLSSAVQLSPVGGQAITSSSNGQVTAMVQIPFSQAPGNYFLYLVSSDSQADALPSLMASVAISVAMAPTPTATPTTVVTPTNTPSTSTIVPSTPAGPSPAKLVAIFGLGALSVVLFIIGVILLASAAALPRQG